LLKADAWLANSTVKAIKI